MTDDGMSFRLSVCEQECEQLQTALENSEAELEKVARENEQLQMERTKWLRENARLRHLLAQSHARLLETQIAARKSISCPVSGLESELSIVNEELQISLEELQVTTEELEEANAALMRTNEMLEQQVAERTEHLEQALAERDELLHCKDHLLYEIGHRVRDSLQVVMGLIRIQIGRSREPVVQQALQATGARIHAVAQVHDRLFTSDGSGRVSMDRYLREICQGITDAVGVDEPRQTLEVEAEPIELPADLAFPLGLIVTELVSNAFRHAFDTSGTGTVWVQFGRTSGDDLKLVVADDGKGIPSRVEFANTVGLGMHIVALMVQRLKARLTVRHTHGSCFTVRLPENDTHESADERDWAPPRSGSR
jgi:two-component system, sensor histidine kinase PdtaS